MMLHKTTQVDVLRKGEEEKKKGGWGLKYNQLQSVTNAKAAFFQNVGRTTGGL